MRRSRLALVFLPAALTVGAGPRFTPVLSAQVLRCWDVVCTVDEKGNMSCVEKPRPCPSET